MPGVAEGMEEEGEERSSAAAGLIRDLEKLLEGRVRQATISSEMANQVRDGIRRRDLNAVDAVRGLGERG
ncbi:hypothetical protein TNCV_359191 [Trichonephila clavipes]|nr:hypothetical protein TNCV_359191 [Trichonephila clavipes]